MHIDEGISVSGPDSKTHCLILESGQGKKRGRKGGGLFRAGGGGGGGVGRLGGGAYTK